MIRGLAKEDRACLQVNTLVFKPHEQRPHGMILVDNDRSVAIIERGVCHDGIRNSFVYLFPVLVNFRNCRPKHVILVHVIPQHLIHTNFKDTFKVSIHRLGQDSRDTELVYVQTRSVTVIEYLRMTQSMRSRSDEEK